MFHSERKALMAVSFKQILKFTDELTGNEGIEFLILKFNIIADIS